MSEDTLPELQVMIQVNGAMVPAVLTEVPEMCDEDWVAYKVTAPAEEISEK